MSPRSLNRFLAAGLGAGCFVGGCSPELVVGKVVVKEEACPLPDSEGGAPSFEEKSVEIGWTTGYENGFCDYAQALGFCYPDGSMQVVGQPVHEGKSAAAFSVSSDPDVDAGPLTTQSRCFLEGTLPTDAKYGAWFYIPELAVNSGNWNLMYFQGKDAGPGPLEGLWDVSLRNADDGSLRLYILARGQTIPPPMEVPVPIAEWFHVEFRWLRAEDTTGTVELRQGGVLIQSAPGIITDRFDYHQWYVGNLVSDGALDPPDSTLYVDDVTISEP